MDPIRHTHRDDPIDIRARFDELRQILGEFLGSDGEDLVLAGGLRLGPRSLGYTEGDPAEVRVRIRDASSRLRDQSEAIAALLEEERLGVMERELDEGSPLHQRLADARTLVRSLDDALEAVSLLEETPAVELDLARFHATLTALAGRVGGAAPEPLDAAYLLEVDFRL